MTNPTTVTEFSPLDRIIDEIHDHMSEHPARLPESLAETTTALALLEIAASLRKIAAALKSAESTPAAPQRTDPYGIESADWRWRCPTCREELGFIKDHHEDTGERRFIIAGQHREGCCRLYADAPKAAYLWEQQDKFPKSSI